MNFRKPILLVFFAALLVTPLLMRSYLTGSEDRSNDGVESRYGVSFTETARASGINFVHQSPTLDPKLEHIMPIIASMGASVSIVDFDGDGWNDIYFTNSAEGSLNALYRNNRDGSFTDVAGETGIADVNQAGTGVSMGAVWGDIDNDGFDDLFLYKWGRPELFRNDGGQRFVRITDSAGLPKWLNANTAIWTDFDADGLLDLFIGGYFREELDLWHLSTTVIMAESFEYARNGGRKWLFRNLGGGKFEEVSKQLGIDSNRWALAAVAVDIFEDGYPDLFVANDYGVSELYLNEGGKRFVESGSITGVGFSPKSGMSASVGDVSNNGRFAIYVSNISEEGILLQGNNLWVQRPGSTLIFENQAGIYGVELGGWSWGAQFGDLNNDGTLDLFLTNGFISTEDPNSYWYDYSKITIGNNTIIGDARNWAPMNGRSLAGKQANRVWLNDGAGRFNDVAQAIGVVENLDGRAVALADLWNRGVLDVIVANQNAGPSIYKNSAQSMGNWMSIELEGADMSNRSAVGAIVRVFWDQKQQSQQIDGGSGFASQNQRRIHFGLGKGVPEKVEIRWPSGKLQVIEKPEVNTNQRVREPS